MEQQHHPARTPPPALTRGEFAPVYWEPLGPRAERLVVGYLLALDDAPAKAYVTLQHKRLLEFISAKQSDSAVGVIGFTFDFFNRTLAAGGIIEDLRAPFSSMSIGRVERISARTPQEVAERAVALCTLLGQMAHEAPNDDAVRTATKTARFLQDVRQHIRSVDKHLASLAMNTKRKYGPVGAEFRLHFHHGSHFVQFCSLPLPNARVETATECTARLTELQVIRAQEPHAQVSLCINTQTLSSAERYAGKTNATVAVRERTLAMAQALKIPTHQYLDPHHAAAYLREVADA